MSCAAMFKALANGTQFTYNIQYTVHHSNTSCTITVNEPRLPNHERLGGFKQSYFQHRITLYDVGTFRLFVHI